MDIKIIVFFLLFSSQFLFSDDLFQDSSIEEYRAIGVIGDEGVDFKVEEGKILLRYNGNSPHISEKYHSISADDIVIKEDGYPYVTVFGFDESILYGSRFFLFLNPQSNRARHGYKGIGSYEYENKYFTDYSYINYIESLISKIDSTSYLQEGETLYLSDHLNQYLGFFEYSNKSRLPMQIFNGDSIPWVEGVDGPGIGEQLIISFTKPSSDIVVLNGFVDRNRKYLFKANNRVNTAIIRSADSGESFEFEHVFEDVVHFDEIQFPRPAEKIIFEIKDVYLGEKWDDTCISAVLTREPDPYK